MNSTSGSIIDYTGKNDLETVADARLAPQNPYAGSYYSNYFDGTGDYLSIADSGALRFGTGNFTVEFWTNYASQTGTYDFVDARGSSYTNQGFAVYSYNGSIYVTWSTNNHIITTAPVAGVANALNVYTYTIIKTASATYTVLAAQSQFA